MKKSIKLILVFILLLLIVLFILLRSNDDSNLIGEWNSKDGTIIRIIKEYRDGQPVYVNDDILEYKLEIKKNNKYTLYCIDKDKMYLDKSIVEDGKYNIDPNDYKIIYFHSNLENNYIWKCKLNNNRLSDCDDFATEFIK